MSVLIDGVSKTYGHGADTVHALDSVTIDVAPGEFVCLVGASGCGKSTLLNLVANLDVPSSGSVTAAGRTALMFQESALFPWLTVRQNIELALKLRGPKRDGLSRDERRNRALDLLALVRLEGFGDKLPHELSGGMRQRVALARALGQDADILLMDEPFGALDAMTRDLLHHELEQIWQVNRMSVLFVTHNVREAARLADRVVLLSSRPGRVAGEFALDLARPRRIESPEVSEAASAITAHLRAEVRRHAQG